MFAGKLFGRGSTDDKGPVLAWFNCIEAYQKIGKVEFLTFHSCQALLVLKISLELVFTSTSGYHGCVLSHLPPGALNFKL